MDVNQSQRAKIRKTLKIEEIVQAKEEAKKHHKIQLNRSQHASQHDVTEFHKVEISKTQDTIDDDLVQPPVKRHRNIASETASMRFQYDIEEIRRTYTKIDQSKVESDFMYMMISAKDCEKKSHHMRALVGLLKQTFVSKTGTSLLVQEQEILDKILRVNDQDINDTLWFISMILTNSLLDWFINGELIDGKRIPPPPIRDIEMLQYLLRSDGFNELILSFKEGKLDVTSFARAVRSEYAMTVGFNIK